VNFFSDFMQMIPLRCASADRKHDRAGWQPAIAKAAIAM